MFAVQKEGKKGSLLIDLIFLEAGQILKWPKNHPWQWMSLLIFKSVLGMLFLSLRFHQKSVDTEWFGNQNDNSPQEDHEASDDNCSNNCDAFNPLDQSR